MPIGAVSMTVHTYTCKCNVMGIIIIMMIIFITLDSQHITYMQNTQLSKKLKNQKAIKAKHT